MMDRENPDRPVHRKTRANFTAMNNLIKEDKRRTVREIEDITVIPKSSTQEILQNHLSMKKLVLDLFRAFSSLRKSIEEWRWQNS